MPLERSLRNLALTIALLAPSGPGQESVSSNNLVVYSLRSNYCPHPVVDERVLGRPLAPLRSSHYTSWVDSFEVTTPPFRENTGAYRSQ